MTPFEQTAHRIMSLMAPTLLRKIARPGNGIVVVETPTQLTAEWLDGEDFTNRVLEMADKVPDGAMMLPLYIPVGVDGAVNHRRGEMVFRLVRAFNINIDHRVNHADILFTTQAAA